MMHDILVGGRWRAAARPAGSFQAVNPATGKALPGDYPVSAWPDIDDALQAARGAVDELDGAGPERVAAFLKAFADEAERRRQDLVEIAHLETALPAEPRLRSVELPRLTGQLRQAATAARERSWCRAVIDTKAGLRSKLGPLGGPVAVFGPNNFPFAFNALGGGDFAAALAAGNPVIAKANPGHPGTTTILAEAAFAAVEKSGLPRAAVQLLYHFASEDGLRLVSHPVIGASAFTGSRAAGMKLKEAADRAGKPIYLEMSSANPVFILPGALEERSAEIAAELAGSCFLGAGQMCTKPGLVVLVDNPAGHEFVRSLKEAFEKSEPGVLLGRGVLDRLREASNRLGRSRAEIIAGGREAGGLGFRFKATLFRLSGAGFLRQPNVFQVESFGSLCLVVLAKDVDEMKAVASALEGQLTGTIYSHGGGLDDPAYGELEPVLRRKVGRLLNDRMPTGVAVSPAMNHGGPFPATGHPGFTSVGMPAAMLRFAALYCYDHVRPERLPAELKDANPTGKTWRLIDGEWTRRSL